MGTNRPQHDRSRKPLGPTPELTGERVASADQAEDQGLVFEPGSLSHKLQLCETNQRYVITANTAGGFELTKMSLHGAPVVGVLATISKNEIGEIAITDGRPSTNGLYDGNVRLTNAAVFSEGATVALRLGSHEEQAIAVVLPGGEPAVTGERGIALLRMQLQRLAVGERLEVGRSTKEYDFPDTISRKHAVFERLPDVSVEGRAHRVYLVHDGVPSEQGVFIQSETNRWERLMGTVKLGPGRNFTFETTDAGRSRLALVHEVPEPIQEGSNPVAAQELLALRAATLAGASRAAIGRQRMVDGCAVSMVSLPGINPRTLDPDEVLDEAKLQRTRTIGLHLRRGLDMLTREHYTEATEHFSRITVFKRAFPGLDVRFEENHVYKLQRLDAESVVKALTALAMDSWMKSDGKTLVVYPSRGLIAEGLVPQNDEERANLRAFLHDAALLFGEEWIHAYQRGLGRCVSRRGVLLDARGGGDLHEWDVAQVFRDYGVPTTVRFGRIYDRDRIMDEMRGVQTAGEREEIRSILTILKRGEQLVLGSDPGEMAYMGGVENFRVYSPASRSFVVAAPDKPRSEYAANELSPAQARLRHEVKRALGAMHARIYKNGDSTYSVVLGDGVKLFAPDEYGCWEARTPRQGLVTHRGPIRLNWYYELDLP